MASRWSRWLTDRVDALTRRPVAEVTPEPRQEEPPPPNPLEDELKCVQRKLEDAELMLMGKEAEFKNKLSEAQERNAELLDKVVVLTQRERELQARILDAQFDGSGARADAKRLDGELRDLRRTLTARENEVAELAARLAAQDTPPRPADAPGPDARRVEELEERLLELARERDELQGRVARADEECSALRARLAAPPRPAEASPLPAAEKPHQATGPHDGPLRDIAAGKTEMAAWRGRVVQEERQRLAAAAREDAAETGWHRLGNRPRSDRQPPAPIPEPDAREPHARRSRRNRGRRRP